jgi:hypothetical protein
VWKYERERKWLRQGLSGTVAEGLYLHQGRLLVDGHVEVPRIQEALKGLRIVKRIRGYQLRVHRLTLTPHRATVGLVHLLEDDELACSCDGMLI